jgi:mRNA interferase MazF
VTVIRGAVHRIYLGDEKRGHEQRGKRYGIVLSATDWNMVTVVPTSTSAQPSLFRPEISLLDEPRTTLLVDQIRSIDTQYLRDMVGFLAGDDLETLEMAVRRYLRL